MNTVILTDEHTGEKFTTTLEQMNDVQTKAMMMRECMELSDDETRDMILTLLKGESVNLTELTNKIKEVNNENELK
jgi:hypothetical protein